MQKQSKKAEEIENKGFAVLPYVKGVTEKVKRVLQSYKIFTACKPQSTLRQILSKPKDKIEYESKTGVIYQIPCKDCNTVYIGETGRSLATRKKEHMANVRLDKTDSSALAEHANSTGHDIAWENSSLVEQEPRWLHRKWKEACYICCNENSILSNRDNGRNIPNCYLPLMKSKV